MEWLYLRLCLNCRECHKEGGEIHDGDGVVIGVIIGGYPINFMLCLWSWTTKYIQDTKQDDAKKETEIQPSTIPSSDLTLTVRRWMITGETYCMKGISSTTTEILANDGIKRMTYMDGFRKRGILQKGEDVMDVVRWEWSDGWRSRRSRRNRRNRRSRANHLMTVK